MSTPSEIYFQIDEDWTPESGHHPFRDATWSVERINDSDILYMRAPVEERAISRIEAMAVLACRDNETSNWYSVHDAGENYNINVQNRPCCDCDDFFVHGKECDHIKAVKMHLGLE